MKEIKHLIDLLKQEEKVYSEMLLLSEKKTKCISNENIDEINEIAKQEERLIKEARLLEYQREDEITKIEKLFNIEKLDDLSSLLKHIEDKKLESELIETQVNFTNTLSELKNVNSLNNTLIQDALEYITLSLNLMTQATAEGTYGKTAKEAEPQAPQKSMFDFKG